MAEQPDAQAIIENATNTVNNQNRLKNVAREIISNPCNFVSVIFAILAISLLIDYHFYQTKWIFCESKPDACESTEIELLPKCPNETIYIDIQEDYFIVDALFGQDDYLYSNYPLKYNWTIITNDAHAQQSGCDVVIEDTEQQQLQIHFFKDCDPFTINTTLHISVKEFETIYPKQCKVSIFFFESPIFGIDFGTTYSSISFQRKQKNDNNQRNSVIIHEFSGKNNGSELIHSAVYFDADQHTTLIGQDAMDFLETDAENVIYDIKRLIGRNASQDYDECVEFNNTHFFKINDDCGSVYIPNWERDVSFEQVVAIILAYLVESGSDEWLKQKTYFDDKFNDFSKVVVSIPASFHTGQRNAIRNACILAGLNPIRLQSEPSLAAIAFTNHVGNDENIENDLKSFLVFDFGGGTLDAAIIRCTRKVQCTVVSVHGDNHLGGIDFDEVIQHIIEHQLRRNNAMDDSMINALKFTIESMAEQIKIHLSKIEKVERIINGQKIVITRDEFEHHVETEKLKQQMVEVVKEVISRSLKLNKKYSITLIKAVLLVGGTSKLPLVKHTLASYFRNEAAFKEFEIPSFLTSDIDEQLMIIDGAAILSGALNFNDESSSAILSTSIIDVAPLPYGFARCESTPTGLYPVNAFECSVMQKISKTGQFFGTKLSVAEICQTKPKSTNMILDLFEGFNKSVKFNYFLGQIEIHDIEARDPDKPCGNVLLFGEIAKNGSLTFDIFKNPIWEIIISKFNAEHDLDAQHIEKSNLYLLPQLYTNITQHLRMQQLSKRYKGESYVKQPYTLTLTFEEGMEKINKSIDITQNDFDDLAMDKYDYTMNSEESLIETTSSFINDIIDTKSLFDNDTFISVRYGIERAIRKEIKRRSKNETEKTQTELHMQELDKLAFELKRYNEITTEITTAALLSNLSYLPPYDKSRIISDITINGTLYIIFTGTQPNLHDMSFNIDIWKADIFGGRGHRGFHKRAVDYFGNTSFEIWFNGIFKNARQFAGGKRKIIKQIVFGGHSLGGAASEIVGSYFWKHCNQRKNATQSFCTIPSQVITFGAPLTFQRGCNVHPNMTHIVNDNDMIPRILRDFEFLYSGWFAIRMLSPHVPHVFAITVFLSMLSIKYTRYHMVQTIFVCGIWILMVYHFFSTETIRIDAIEYISPIFKWLGLNKVFCDWFHERATREISYMWIIHLIMVLFLAVKRWITKSFEGNDDDDSSSLVVKIWSCIKYLFQPILDFFPVLLRLAALFLPCFVGICFIAPHYYATGNVIHIQSHDRYGKCNKLNGVEFYEKMRTGYQESFFFHDHSIVYYTEVLKSLIEGKIQCGNALPDSSMGQEVEDVVSFLMVIICVLFFWIYFLRVVTQSAEEMDNPENNEPPFQPEWGYWILAILSIASFFSGPMREVFNL